MVATAPEFGTNPLTRLRLGLRSALSLFSTFLPKGLYTRALIIIIAPMVLLESVVAFVFMERHWDQMTQRLSASTAGDVGVLVELYANDHEHDDYRRLIRLADEKMGLNVQILPAGDLPPARPKVYFDLLDRTLSAEISKQVKAPFWLDTVGRSRQVELRVKLSDAVMRIIVNRNQTYASNSHILLAWMVGTSMVLLTVAIMFLRNQIRPILRLADAADAFGKGRPAPLNFRPRGAREIRLAANAFLEMRDRIERHVEQRTTMLAGVSHDLRTVLTRFKLQLAMFHDSPEVEALRGDANEMQLMLQDYMAFAKGGSGEEATPTDIRAMVEEVREEALHIVPPDTDKRQRKIDLKFKRRRHTPVALRRHGFKRAIGNLVSNAVRYADRVVVTVRQDGNWLRIEVDDNGPGIPPEKRETVFRPFYRLDDSRNQDHGNTGLGLAIARDIARVHGGEIWLDKSVLGGLKAIVKVPI